MPALAEIDDRIDRASARPFGRRFHLRGRERATAELRGPRTMRAHAAEITAERLAPAEPRNDGRQTPYRNHPVFVAGTPGAHPHAENEGAPRSWRQQPGARRRPHRASEPTLTLSSRWTRPEKDLLA
jgi:hypothetical protein